MSPLSCLALSNEQFFALVSKMALVFPTFLFTTSLVSGKEQRAYYFETNEDINPY